MSSGHRLGLLCLVAVGTPALAHADASDWKTSRACQNVVAVDYLAANDAFEKSKAASLNPQQQAAQMQLYGRVVGGPGDPALRQRAESLMRTMLTFQTRAQAAYAAEKHLAPADVDAALQADPAPLPAMTTAACSDLLSPRAPPITTQAK